MVTAFFQGMGIPVLYGGLSVLGVVTTSNWRGPGHCAKKDKSVTRLFFCRQFRHVRCFCGVPFLGQQDQRCTFVRNGFVSLQSIVCGKKRRSGPIGV